MLKITSESALLRHADSCLHCRHRESVAMAYIAIGSCVILMKFKQGVYNDLFIICAKFGKGILTNNRDMPIVYAIYRVYSCF